MLKPSNYSLWAIRMQIILEANGLWEMIEPDDKTQADNKKDKTAMAFLYQALPEEQLLQITKHKTAKAIWDALKTRHMGEERVQQARLQTLKSEFEMLHMKEDETIDAFTTKLTTLVNKASSLGHTMKDGELVRKLLNAVPDRTSPQEGHRNKRDNKGESMYIEEEKSLSNEFSAILKSTLTDNEPEWTDFKIGDTEVTNEYHDQETEPTEDNDEFPNNNDDYASPPRDSPLQHQTPHTSPRHSPEVISQVTPDTSRQSNYQGDHDSTQVINSPSQFDHTPVRGFRTLSDLYENTEELLLAEDEPKNYKEASSDQKWIEAMKTELDSINRNNTWELTTLPTGHKAIGLKWIFKTKKDANGDIIKHKARLVAKGYIQQHGIDFEEVFAPVARMETIRLLLAIAATNKWEVHHLDVKSAFLHGDLKEEVYVTQPEGFTKEQDKGKVYRLIKALYGLRQAPRAWNIKLDNTLKSLDFKKCALEQAIYTKTSKDSTLLIGVYVDDLIITGAPKKEIDKFKAQMKEKFEMSDLGLLAYYLGIEVTQANGDISIKQSAYASKILKEAGMIDCNETLIPMDPGTRLTKITEGTMVDSTEYRSIIGCLRYLLHTRPDLSYSVGLLSRFMQEPKEQHMKAIRQVLRYVKGTKDYGITYKHNGGNKIHGFSDSSYGVNTQEGKGTTGIIFYYGESPISWSTQKQATVALSSCESEFIAATAAATQALWLKRLLGKLTQSQEEKITIQVDNKSAIALMKNPVFHGRSKHIDIKYHFIRECMEREDIQVEFINGEYQKADILTKALPKIRFLTMRQLIGLKDLSSSACD
ncbi:ribonuclease H-like domain, reverse transcriptase, RNA-dependent DNA polymerase [Tanacetum coccineum]